MSKTGTTILVVDDEPDIRDVVREILEDEGYRVVAAADADSAAQQFAEQDFDLVLLDIWMPGQDGISLLKQWSDSDALTVTKVIMMSGHGNIETAVTAVRMGAYDFIEKPLSIDALLLTVERAVNDVKLIRENLALKKRLHSPVELVGDSPPMQQLRKQLEALAETDSWALITGEPGAGKRLAAHYLHRHSSQSDGPLVDLNLAAVPAENVAVQLFGYEQDGEVYPGKFEQADKGILLLNEIGDMDVDTQTKLLNSLLEKQFLRVGGKQYVSVDVRVVAISSEDIAERVTRGEFREDLYYRLNVIPIQVPPLRDHRQDIPALAAHFMHGLNPAGSPRLDQGALAELAAYSWPGNVRELQNMVQRLMVFYGEQEISRQDVQATLEKRPCKNAPQSAPDSAMFDQPIRNARDQFEKSYLEYHMQQAGGNVSEVARKAGLERTHLYRKLKSLNIDPKTGKTRKPATD